MKLRTISQLPEIQTDNSLPGSSLFEVSVPSDQKYISHKVQVQTIKNFVQEDLEENIRNGYGLVSDTGENINVNGLKNQVDNILSGKTTITGRKTFSEHIRCTEIKDVDELADNQFMTKENVIDICNNQGNFISPDTTYVDANPENDTPNTVFNEDYFMKWQFDQDGRDSSEFVKDIYSGQKADPVFATATGSLVVYGWLADNGGVTAPEAWVGLYGKVTIGNENTQEKKWVALQIQPWIIGTKSSSMQYVSFNVPVKKGLQMKIMTGFPVNTQNNQGFQDPSFNTLQFTTNQPCSFVGYILRND